MSEMAEVVARAMLKNLVRLPQDGGEHGCIISAISPDMNLNARGHVWLTELARAAIAAMEPTPQMMKAGMAKRMDGVGLIWRAMRDEALR